MRKLQPIGNLTRSIQAALLRRIPGEVPTKVFNWIQIGYCWILLVVFFSENDVYATTSDVPCRTIDRIKALTLVCMNQSKDQTILRQCMQRFYLDMQQSYFLNSLPQCKIHLQKVLANLKIQERQLAIDKDHWKNQKHPPNKLSQSHLGDKIKRSALTQLPSRGDLCQIHPRNIEQELEMVCIKDQSPRYCLDTLASKKSLKEPSCASQIKNIHYQMAVKLEKHSYEYFGKSPSPRSSNLKVSATFKDFGKKVQGFFHKLIEKPKLNSVGNKKI